MVPADEADGPDVTTSSESDAMLGYAIDVARRSTGQAMQASLGVVRFVARGPLRFATEGYRFVQGMAVEGLRQALEIPELRQAVELLEAQEPSKRPMNALLEAADADVDDEDRLRRRFQSLLDRSLDPQAEHAPHPAFADILAQLSPDEARILRLLADTPQLPVVDVQALSRSIARSGTVVAANLSRIGDRAGCNEPDRTPIYLDNLSRLGLVHIDPDELPGHADYELIEVSPAFLAASRRVQSELGLKVRSHRQAARVTSLGARLLGIVVPDVP